MKSFVKILENVGLNPQAAETYLALLEHGKSGVSDIARNTGLHRTQIYRLLPGLLDSGFVLAVAEGKRVSYVPAPPSKINEAFEERKRSHQGGIRELEEKYRNLERKTSVVFRKGADGIRDSYRDIAATLPEGGVFYRITSEVDVDTINERYIPKDYKPERDRKGIGRLIIMSEKTAAKKRPKLERETRVISSDMDDFDDDVIFTVYGDKVSYVDFNTETSILIESKEIADFQKKVFRLLFKKLGE